MILNEAEGVQYELFNISDLHDMAAMTAEVFTEYDLIRHITQAKG